MYKHYIYINTIYIYTVYIYIHSGISWNGGTPKSSILMGFSIINHPAFGVSPFLETDDCVISQLLSLSKGTTQ